MLFYLSQMITLGLMTAFTPCPLATNIATISYISQSIGNPKKSLISSLFYTLGRIVAYTIIGLILHYSLMSAPKLSYTLQEILPQYLGPLFILSGMVILQLISLPSLGKKLSSQHINKFLNHSLYGGAFCIGFILSIVLCPVSAAIFFGQVIPLSLVQNKEAFGLGISLFGFGTALPVFGFALLLILSLQKARLIINHLPLIQSIMKNLTGWGFIFLGLYWIVTRIFLTNT